MNAEQSEFEDAYEGEEDGQLRYRNERAPASKRPAAKAAGKRRNKAPAQVNGIHRRRRKRISW